jgi:hypothetical protein
MEKWLWRSLIRLIVGKMGYNNFSLSYVYRDKESVKTHIKNFLIDKKDIKCQKLQVVNM